jgi:hypothetical protein
MFPAPDLPAPARIGPFLICFWLLLALVLVLQQYGSGDMPLGNSLLYAGAIVGTCVGGTHALSDGLLPWYQQRQQLGRFLAVALVACGLLAVALALLDIQLERWLTAAVVPLRFLPRVAGMFLGVLLATGAICGMRFFRDHARMAQENQFLRATHLETELQRLRDQINPHVVFNVLNSIHVLLHKDAAQASVVLLRFADMLRYQLYECAQPTIALAQEVHYLQSFVAVERIRWGTQLQVDCQWDAASDAQIAPFLLAPFVENAFKHISRHLDQQNRITISLQLRDEHLLLQVENTREPELTDPATDKTGGIGLRNVQARLQLLYPERHLLHVLPTPTHFAVTLQLHLAPAPSVAAGRPAH